MRRLPTLRTMYAMAAQRSSPGCLQPLGCFGGLLVAVAAYGAMWGFDAYINAPWAHAIGGRPTLTGQWTGSVSAHASPGGVVTLEIIRGSGSKRGGVPQVFDNGSFTGRPYLHGTATWCRADGTTGHYTLRGTATHSGDSLRITFTPPSLPNGTSQELMDTQGAWTGSTLVLAGLVQTYLPKPGHPRVAATIPDTLNLHRVQGGGGGACALPATRR